MKFYNALCIILLVSLGGCQRTKVTERPAFNTLVSTAEPYRIDLQCHNDKINGDDPALLRAIIQVQLGVGGNIEWHFHNTCYIKDALVIPAVSPAYQFSINGMYLDNKQASVAGLYVDVHDALGTVWGPDAEGATTELGEN